MLSSLIEDLLWASAKSQAMQKIKIGALLRWQHALRRAQVGNPSHFGQPLQGRRLGVGFMASVIC